MNAPAVTAVTITVTRQHLDEGRRGDCAACPVALAVKDAFPRADLVWVGNICISVRGGGPSVTLIIPDDVRARIAAFDRGKHVEPFTFTVDYPGLGS